MEMNEEKQEIINELRTRTRKLINEMNLMIELYEKVIPETDSDGLFPDLVSKHLFDDQICLMLCRSKIGGNLILVKELTGLKK